MKAACYYDIGDIRCEEVDKPRIGMGEILIRVRVCGLCGTDVSKMREKSVPVPAVLGHEIAGDIAELGEGVEGFEAGERIVVTHHVPCFVCNYCRHGNYSQCDSFKRMNIIPGGFAEYIRVLPPGVEKSVFKIPAHLSYEEACFTETAACCLRAIERCGIRAGDTVMIVGAGVVGLLHLQLAKLFGAGRIIVTDLVDFRLDAASRMGADVTINIGREKAEKRVDEITDSFGVDVVIAAVGNVAALGTAFSCVSKGGKILFFAECPRDSVLKLDPNLVYHSEVTLLGSYSSTPVEQRAALRLIESGKIRVKELITHRFKLDELAGAVTLAMETQNSLKIIIQK